MARLRQTAAAARQIQREQLQTILQQNAAAAYGLRHGFSGIRSLADLDIAMVIVTHEMAFARDVSSHVVYMNQGVICEEGTPEQVFGNPQKQETQDFLSRFRKN